MPQLLYDIYRALKVEMNLVLVFRLLFLVLFQSRMPFTLMSTNIVDSDLLIEAMGDLLVHQ